MIRTAWQWSGLGGLTKRRRFCQDVRTIRLPGFNGAIGFFSLFHPIERTSTYMYPSRMEISCTGLLSAQESRLGHVFSLVYSNTCM